ncbi:hypothetical protein HDU92_007313 [Lobulomyces angularis]|nr:hypothetical protein HDU92_007313 [Lobulomyces angularis]
MQETKFWENFESFDMLQNLASPSINLDGKPTNIFVEKENLTHYLKCEPIGITTTCNDLTKWMQYLLKNEDQFLKLENFYTKEEETHLVVDDHGNLDYLKGGEKVTKSTLNDSVEEWTHSGFSMGYTSRARIFPQFNFGVFVVSNCLSSPLPELVSSYIIESLFDLPIEKRKFNLNKVLNELKILKSWG